MIKYKSRPMVEILEDRWVPANIWYDGSGNLFVDIKNADLISAANNANRVQVTVGAANAVTVQLDDVAAAATVNLGTYTVSGNLTVMIGNTTRAASFATNNPHLMAFGGNSLPGNVSWTIGNASAAADFGTTGVGSVAGNFSVRTGNGNNDIRLGVTGAGALAVAGSVWIDTGTGGTDAVTIAGAGCNLAASGNVSIRNAQTVTTATSTNGAQVQGNLTIEANPKSGAKTITLAVAPAFTTVNGNLRIITGGGLVTDVATVNFGGSVAGSAYINMGNNNNTLNFGVAGVATNVVLKDVVFSGGNTNNTLNFGTASSAIVAGNLVFRTGNGLDAATFGNAGNSMTVLGKTITGVTGNGSDTVTSNNLVAGGARFTLVLGNGNDVFTTGTTNSFNVAQSLVWGGLGVDTYTTAATPFVWNFPHRFLSFVNI